MLNILSNGTQLEITPPDMQLFVRGSSWFVRVPKNTMQVCEMDIDPVQDVEPAALDAIINMVLAIIE